MDGYEQEIHINDELFADMREATDRVLQKLLKTWSRKTAWKGR